MATSRFADIADLLAAVELESVEFIELRAERVATREAEPGVVQLGVAHEQTAAALLVSFQCVLRHEVADIIAAVQCRYGFIDMKPDAEQRHDDTTGPAGKTARPEPTVPALRDFIEKIAVMAAYPYLRQGVHTLASMLGLPGVTLGLLRAGSFTIGDGEGETPAAGQ